MATDILSNTPSGGYITRLARSAQILLREGGLRGFWESFRTFLFCSQRIEVFMIELSKGYRMPAIDPRVEIHQATPEDLIQIRALPEGKRIEFYRDQIDGAEPFVALWEGRPAHIAWIYDSRMPTRFIRLKPGEAELRYGYTCHGFRGRGLYGATNAFMLAELTKKGYKRVYGHVVEHTVAFRMGLELALTRIGFRKVRTFTHLRVLGIQIRPHLSL